MQSIKRADALTAATLLCAMLAVFYVSVSSRLNSSEFIALPDDYVKVNRQRPPLTQVPPRVRIDLNDASSQELQKIPGIGPRLGQRIIEHRRKHGAFTEIEQLLRVKGIGKHTLEKIRPFVHLQPGEKQGTEQ